MNYRVCIPAAGTGSRLEALTKFINKSLVSIANRPILSHLIEKFPANVEFVIALGHKGHLVREFLELAYPQRKFFFAEVEKFEGEGSGLGLSLLACKQHLQQPFIFLSCDTLVQESIPAPDHDWMGYSEVDDVQQYRALKIESGIVENICEKGDGKKGEHHPYIGLAGINKYQDFWKQMEQGGDRAIEVGEVFGIGALLNNKIHAHKFTWHDAGNIKALALAREFYHQPDSPNILEKVDEAIWFVDDQVIKFSNDKKFIANRVKRSSELCGFVPEVLGSKPHMYKYRKVVGNVLSDIATLPIFKRFLEHSKNFWELHKLNQGEAKEFQNTCMKFYRDKTLERVELFYKNFSRHDGNEKINDIEVPKLITLLNDVDWSWLSDGLAGRFHGDFHFENIVCSSDRHFTFLDWRQDFGGSLTSGDIYYDFAKLLHGLIISHELIAKKCFSVEWNEKEINYDFYRKQMLVECEKYFYSWLEENGYDSKKTRTLTAIIYLNIAALHHHPYSLLLFSLGKLMLFKEQEKHEIN